MENADITVEEETNLLHDAMVSIMHKYPHFSYDKDAKTEMMSFANSFDDIGYGFAAIKCSVNCNRSIIVEVDPAYIFTYIGVFIIKGTDSRVDTKNLAIV
jgi:hypothetical protein